MTRDNYIHELVKYELEFLIDNPNLINETTEFFSTGGFSTWSDESIQKKYNLFIAEEQ